MTNSVVPNLHHTADITNYFLSRACRALRCGCGLGDCGLCGLAGAVYAGAVCARSVRGLGWLLLFDCPSLAGWLVGGRCVGWAGCLVCLCRTLCVCVPVCVCVCLCLVVAVGRSLGWLCVVVAGCVWRAGRNRAVCLFWGCRGLSWLAGVNGARRGCDGRRRAYGLAGLGWLAGGL